jgi:hypothetical protein
LGKWWQASASAFDYTVSNVMARSHESVALTVLVIAEVPNFWSGFLPSLFTIATFSGGDEDKAAHTKRWIRRGEIQAVGLSIALGLSASLLAEEPWPFIGVLFLIGYLAYQYEHALRLGLSSGLDMDMAG